MKHFLKVGDPRVQNRTKHELSEILFISVCGILCGAASFVEIEEFAEDKREWLERFLELENGIPSHDTIARVHSILNMSSFEGAFFSWVKELAPKHVSLDGKVVRGTSRRFQGSKGLSLVSVYSSDLGVVLGQKTSKGRGTLETDAVLECLESLSLKGTLVSVDAGTANRRVTKRVRERGGNYLVPIKLNQRHSLHEVEDFFTHPKSKKIKLKATKKERGHGRDEERTCEVLPADALSEMFHNQWTDVKTVLKVSRRRTSADNRYLVQKNDGAGKNYYELNTATEKTTTEEVYYVSSQKLSAKEGLFYVRSHWSIENNLHWTLDVIFQEDQWTVRDKAAAASLGLIRRLAYNLVKRNTSKGSARVKLKRAAWKSGFLEELIFGGTAPA